MVAIGASASTVQAAITLCIRETRVPHYLTLLMTVMTLQAFAPIYRMLKERIVLTDTGAMATIATQDWFLSNKLEIKTSQDKEKSNDLQL